MKLDKPLMMEEQSRLLPRIVRAVLIGVAVVVAIMLLVAPKPWEVEQSMPEWSLKQCIRFSLWWAGLLALPVLSVLALTVRRWTAPVQELWHIGLKNRMPRLFWPIVGAITILYAVAAAPRLRQSLWDDEVYTVRKIVLGTDRIQSDGSAKIKQLPWSHTLWHCEGARNHGLQSILCRLSLGVYRAIVRPEGLQFSETAVRLPSFIAGALSIPALALLVARLGFPWAGVVAAGLLALHPWHLRLATEARGYPFVLLFIPLIALCVARAAPSGNWRWLAAFAALEFALLDAWPGTLLTVLLANAALLALIFRFAASRETASTTLSRWLAANAFVGLALLPFVAPWIPQVLQYMATTPGFPLLVGWFKNTGALLLSGSLWSKTGLLDSPYLELLPRAVRHPFELWTVVILAGLFIVAGALRMMRTNPVCASVLAVLLIPGPLLVLLAEARGTYLQEWYVASMLPGLVAVAAIGMVNVVSGFQRVRALRWAPIPLALLLIAGYAAFTTPIRHRLISRSVEPFRESVEMTRPTLDPNAPENRQIITASSLMFPLAYDPLVRKALTVEEYKTLMREADARNVLLFVNNGFIAGVKDRYPEIHEFLEDKQYFECLATLHGTEPMFDRTVYKYRRGSLGASD
jgi:Dolichyl-phosphate-mannose-protein mannosyltransferase